MKKLSLMLALVLALGVFATACSEDDAGAKTVFKAYHPSNNVQQVAAFFDNSNFEMIQYRDQVEPAVEYGWRGVYGDMTNLKQAPVVVTNWNDNGAGWTNDTTLTGGFKDGFYFSYDGATLATSAELVPSYGPALRLYKATN